MNDLNTVTISGNVARDPEFKQVTDEFAVAKFAVAVSRSKKVGDDYEDVASFIEVECLGKPYAALADRKIRKGNRITLTGRLEQQRWENEAGEKRSKVVVIATEITGECFFKKDDDIAAKSDVDAPQSTPAAAPAAAADAQVAAAVAADDDIPF